MAQDLLRIAMLVASGSGNAGGDCQQPYDYMGVSEAAVGCLDIDVMYSVVGCGRGTHDVIHVVRRSIIGEIMRPISARADVPNKTLMRAAA